MSGPGERRRAVDLYSATPMDTAQVVECLGYPTGQCPERRPAKDPGYAGHMAKPIIPLETKGQDDRTGAGRHARKQAAPQGRGAGTGERGDAGGGGGRGKGPGRRPAAPVGQGEDPVDRPVGAGVFARLDDMLARHRAGRPPTATTPGSGLTDTPGRVSGWPAFAASEGGYGYRRAKAMPRTRVSEKAVRGIMAGTGLSRTRPNGAGTVPAGARRLPRPAAWPTGASPPDGRTGSGWRASPGIRAGDGKGVPLAAGRLPRRQDRRVRGRFRSRRRARRQDARQGRGITAGGSASPGAFQPRPPPPVARTAGAHGPLRPGAADGRQRPFPGRRRGGALRTHEGGIRPSRASGGCVPATRRSPRSTTASAGTTTSASNGRSAG